MMRVERSSSYEEEMSGHLLGCRGGQSVLSPSKLLDEIGVQCFISSRDLLKLTFLFHVVPSKVKSGTAEAGP